MPSEPVKTNSPEPEATFPPAEVRAQSGSVLLIMMGKSVKSALPATIVSLMVIFFLARHPELYHGSSKP